VSLSRAPRKWTYLVTWGWLDLLSSIPTVDALRWGRTARVMRILRVLRGVRSTRALAHFLVQRRAQSALLATLLLSLLHLVFASIVMLQFETAATSNIRTAGGAMVAAGSHSAATVLAVCSDRPLQARRRSLSSRASARLTPPRLKPERSRADTSLERTPRTRSSATCLTALVMVRRRR
jgi:voltage-gated potassium channel